jgi:uncharacterized membrane protein YfcA
VTPLELTAIAVAGVGAGFINTLAGSGTLITFPTLLAFGVPPVTANVSNNIGLVPGAVSGAWGWRHELRQQKRRLLRLAPASLVGGLVGAVLLLVLPAEAFEAIVPALVLLGLVLVAVQPWLNRRVDRHAAHEAAHEAGTTSGRSHHDHWTTIPAVGLTGVYGGYFGAAQGILLVGALGITTGEPVHATNAMKNALSAIVNAVAAVVFIVVAEVDWVIAALIGVGSVVGALLGSRVGRRLPPAVLRGAILVMGTTALVVFLTR